MLRIGETTLMSRLIVGTGKYASFALMREAIEASGAQVVTVAVRRINLNHPQEESLLDHLDRSKMTLLPNTAGCYSAEEAIRTYHEQWPPAKTVFADEATGRVGQVLDSLVANGCIISGGAVRRSILSPDVRVNSFAEVEDSILMEHVEVGRYAKIRRAIVDKDVIIPRYAEIGYHLDEDRRRFHVTESGIVVVGKGTVIEEPRPAVSLAET